MTRRLLPAGFVALLCCAPALSQQTPAYGPRDVDSVEEFLREFEAQQEARTRLTPDQQRVVTDMMRHLAQRVVDLRTQAREAPADASLARTAEDLQAYYLFLKNARFQRDPAKYDQASAYTYGGDPPVIFLCDAFFNLEPPAQKGREGELRTMIRRHEQAALVIHECLHAQKHGILTKINPAWGGERGEDDAYTEEYRWLRTLNDGPLNELIGLMQGYMTTEFEIPSPELRNCLQKLLYHEVLDAPPGYSSPYSDLDPSDRVQYINDLLADAAAKLDAKLRIPPAPQQGPRALPPLAVTAPPTDQQVKDAPRGTDELDRQLPPKPASREPAAVRKWENDCVSKLEQLKAADPERERNKEMYLKTLTAAKIKGDVVGKAREMPCTGTCGQKTHHWWLEDRWSCSVCEHCIMPHEVLTRPDGETFHAFAQRRIKLYDDKIAAIRAEAHRLAGGR